MPVATVGTADGIHLTRWGSGPAVLMVHGGGQGGPSGGEHLWPDQRPLADRGYELVLPDRPGHGQTPTRGPEDIEVDAVWVAEMLGEGAHLVGHSYGGAIALCAAGLRPDAVRSLTLIETPVFSAARGRPEVEAFRGRVERAVTSRPSPLALVRLMRAVNIPVRILPGPKPGLRHLGPMGRGVQAMRPPYDWDAGEAIRRVRAAGIPFLAVTGGWEPGFEAIADELAEQLGGRHLTIDAGHHFPQMAGEPRGAEFNDALGRLLDGAPGA